MNGIYLSHDGWILQPEEIVRHIPAAIRFENRIAICEVYYKTPENRDRAWAMLENAIATGVRLFRFPTDAEVEGEEE